MVRRELTEVSLAGIDPQLQRRVLEMYKTDYFILRSTDDLVATQYGGALKNI